MKLWWRRRRSIRLRLAAFLTALFVLLGGTLLAVSYALVRSNLTVEPRQLAETAAERLGLEPGLVRGAIRDTVVRERRLDAAPAPTVLPAHAKPPQNTGASSRRSKRPKSNSARRPSASSRCNIWRSWPP